MPRIAAIPLAALLAVIVGCDERSETISHQVAQAPMPEGDASIATGVGGRASYERSEGDPLRYAYYGLPQTEPLDPPLTVLVNEGYLVGYDFDRHAPAWAAYRLFAGEHGDAKEGKGGGDDPRVRAGQPPAPAKGSQAQARRQLVPGGPIASCYGEAAGGQTRLSSDFAPAAADAGWNAVTALEPAYARANEELWVMCGPIFGANAAPEGYWKVQIAVQSGRTAVQGFIFPAHEPARKDGSVDVAACLASLEDIEDATGLTFLTDFHDVDDHESRHVIETRRPVALWPTESAPRTAANHR